MKQALNKTKMKYSTPITNDDAEFDEEDADLVKMTLERLANDSGERYTWEEFKKMHGITDKDLEGWEEVEIE